MRNGSMQLTLLPYFEVEKVIESADTLLEMLNDGRSKKEEYNAEDCFEFMGHYIVVAQKKDGQRIFNCIDKNGKIPEGLSADWRILPLVLHDVSNTNP